MEILLNNKPRELPVPTSLQQLLDSVVGDSQKGIAVAINNTVIPKANWPTQQLQQNDQILIIKASQGG